MSNWAVRLTLEVKEGIDDPLTVISGIVDSSRGIESSLREWVRVARSKGHTWQEVADALRVTRQSAWMRFKDVTRSQSTNSDPAFASAVEHAYLRELSRLAVEPDSDLGAIHKEFLARAIYAADRTNGGLRFKKLDERSELEARLLRALSLRVSR
jgi:uncharacterized NAD(P)/FAD-binding protein YdhS